MRTWHDLLLLDWACYAHDLRQVVVGRDFIVRQCHSRSTSHRFTHLSVIDLQRDRVKMSSILDKIIPVEVGHSLLDGYSLMRGIFIMRRPVISIRAWLLLMLEILDPLRHLLHSPRKLIHMTGGTRIASSYNILVHFHGIR